MKALQTIACVVALSGAAAGFTIEALPTHSVFYAGLPAQPCLRVKVTASAGETLSQLSFGASGAISAAWLYRSSAPFFSLLAEGEAAATKVAKSSTAPGTGNLVFKTGGIKLQEGVNYFWLVYDISSSAKGGDKIRGVLKKAVDGLGAETTPAKGRNGTKRADGKTPATPAEVYPFKYRIAPYVRPKFALGSHREIFTAAHLRQMTDFIIFGYTHAGPRIAPAHDALRGQKDLAPECLTLARELRGRECPTRILAGFSCNEAKNPMSAIMHDAEKRRTLARNMAALVTEHGYEGIDIDWEYPRENGRFKPHATWRKFAIFLAELREELAGTGASISIAVTTRYDAPNIEALEGADFINTMSYGRPGEHSTKADAQADIQYLLKRKIPPVKIVLGLPFFSRDTKPKHDDHGGCGYSSIVKFAPKLDAAKNTFRHPETGEQHFFNGPALIKDKCKTFVLQQGIGGVCIWAYDTDVPMNNPKSLSKALYTILKQTKR